MKARLLPILVLSLLLCSCAQQQGVALQTLPDFTTGSGRLVARQVSQDIDEGDFRQLTAATVAYFDQYLVDNMPPLQVAIQLRNLIHSPAFVDFEYTEDKTTNAQLAFENAQGNCIAYSHLYLSLARHFGLKTRYQLVESDPTLVLRDQKISLFIHVNAIVQLPNGKSFTADTVPRQQHLIKQGQILNDNSADALHYNNLAMNAMFANDYPNSYRYLAKAISLDPQLSLLWSNIGALFRKNQQLEAAKISLHNALAIDPQAYPALNNLAVLYQQQNNSVKTQYYLNKIQNYRARNPYHHYNLALLAMNNNDYALALKHVKKSIRLKKDEAEFYYRQSLIYEQLQQLSQSQRAISQAIAIGNNKKRLRAYQQREKFLSEQLQCAGSDQS